MRDARARLERGGRDRGSADLSPLAAGFLRGLGLGALVGAAIAGSAIWRRARDVRQDTPPTESARPPEADPA